MFREPCTVQDKDASTTRRERVKSLARLRTGTSSIARAPPAAAAQVVVHSSCLGGASKRVQPAVPASSNYGVARSKQDGEGIGHVQGHGETSGEGVERKHVENEGRERSTPARDSVGRPRAGSGSSSLAHERTLSPVLSPSATLGLPPRSGSSASYLSGHGYAPGSALSVATTAEAPASSPRSTIGELDRMGSLGSFGSVPKPEEHAHLEGEGVYVESDAQEWKAARLSVGYEGVPASIGAVATELNAGSGALAADSPRSTTNSHASNSGTTTCSVDTMATWGPLTTDHITHTCTAHASGQVTVRYREPRGVIAWRSHVTARDRAAWGPRSNVPGLKAFRMKTVFPGAKELCSLRGAGAGTGKTPEYGTHESGSRDVDRDVAFKLSHVSSGAPPRVDHDAVRATVADGVAAFHGADTEEDTLRDTGVPTLKRQRGVTMDDLASGRIYHPAFRARFENRPRFPIAEAHLPVETTEDSAMAGRGHTDEVARAGTAAARVEVQVGPASPVSSMCAPWMMNQEPHSD